MHIEMKATEQISYQKYKMTIFSDIEPKWENEANREGGRLVVEMSKSDRNEVMIANWLNTILGLIGEHCSVENVAKCYGVQFQSRRKGTVISLFFSEKTNVTPTYL